MRTLTARPYALAITAACLALATLVTLSPWPASQPDSARADEGVKPVIHSVSPARPYCVLARSPHLWARTLTITGENFDVDAERHLHFRFLGRGAVSIHFGREVQWVSSTEIQLDMALIEEHLRDEERFPAIVRLTAGYSDNPRESYMALSDWSDAFFVAVDEEACGVAQPTPTPTPTPTPFPPTTPMRGLAGDLWADVILGKPDFSEIAPYEVVPHKVFNPGGVVVDRTLDPGRAYVWDSGNSRVLGIHLAECYAGGDPCSADVVLGQPSGYDHSACNGDGGFQNFPFRALAGPDTLCGMPDLAISPGEEHTFVTMAVSADGALYVPDSHNNRVLKYASPFENDSSAVRVWGQADFSGILCNQDFGAPTAETLCFHSHTNRLEIDRYGSGVELDSEGNLWVADGGNNRVLRFPLDPDTGEIAKAADLVLGQPDFESDGPGPEFKEFRAPSAVAIDENGLLYVADTGNDRVLVFEPPFQTGMRANRKFEADFNRPVSVETDPSGQGIWINDMGNDMVELWNPTGELIPVADHPGIAGGIGIDSQSNLLVALTHHQDIALFAPRASGGDGDAPNQPERRLFAKGQEYNYLGRKGLSSARGIVVWEDQLIVSDIWRLMFWNGLDTITDGQPADGVVGDGFFVIGGVDCCGRIKVDAAGRLWVTSFDGRGFIDVYQLPLTEHSAPIHTIWTREATFPVLGADDRIALGRRIFGIAPVGQGEFLWLADTDNHRVLRIRDPLVSPVVDVVLGQESAGGTLCNRAVDLGPHANVGRDEMGEPTANTLCFPGALSIDWLGNLYVSDHSLEVDGNRRLLVFLAPSISTNNSSPIFAPSAVKIFTDSTDGTANVTFPQWTLDGMIDMHRPWLGTAAAATWEAAFDSTNRMAIGYNGYVGARFVGTYDEPLGPDTLPTSYLYDVGSMFYATAFDHNDNLYVGDLNRGRVLVYLNPFSNAPRPSSPTTPEPSAPPHPEHPAAILSASPAPPYCVLRGSARPYETTLEFAVDGLPDDDDLLLEFRKVTSAHVELYAPAPQLIEDSRSRIVIPQAPFWERLWPHIHKVTLTVRVTQRDGAPLSNWSPAFLLADDAESCGVALQTPTPEPTPTPTPEPTATPTPEPTPTPTREPTSTPTPEPTPTPTPEPTPTPTPEPTSTPTPEPIPTPTPEPTPTPTPEPTSTPTPEPTPTPTPEPTPTPPPEPTPTPTPEPSPTPEPTPQETPAPVSGPAPERTPAPTSTPDGGRQSAAVLTLAGLAAALVGGSIYVFMRRSRRR